MITKIFYSLVLFPEIRYGTIIDWYSILNIDELSFWSILVSFSNWTEIKEIIFNHIDFGEKKSILKSKNWNFFSQDISFLNKIYKLVTLNEVNDFNFFKSADFYNKIPFWTVLTITSKCNLFCNYCFNDYDYPLKDRNLRKWLWLEDYKKIVDILYKYWTRDIIITWWEPFSSPFLFDLLEYIKNKWIFIRVNTNGTLLLDKTLEKLNNEFSLNLMVSMHEFNNKDFFEINQKWAKKIKWIDWLKSFEDKFERKVNQLLKIKEFSNLTLDFLTILTPRNILNLEEIYEFVLKKFKLENWHFFRLYSTNTTTWISKSFINLAIHKLYKLNKKYKTNYKIVDSVPFCVTKDIEIAKTVIDWELSQNHNVKTIITTDWNIQIMSAFDSNLWSIFKNDLLQVWQWEFVQKMLNNWFLPKDCYDCKYKNECRGWSRMDANIYNWGYDALDPLCNLENKIKL